MCRTLPELEKYLAQYMAVHFPRLHATRLIILTREGGEAEPISLPLDADGIAVWARREVVEGLQAAEPSPAPNGQAPANGQAAAQTFEPNDYQAMILEILEYRALRAEPLIAELEARGANGDRRRLWKPGGIKELIEHGWVSKDLTGHKLGYFREDMPPPELSDPPAGT